MTFPNNIVIITDAWFPQTNGVVHTLKETGDMLEKNGHSVHFITPSDFKYTMPLPTYSEIKLAFTFGLNKKLQTLKDAGKMDALHISTEGTLGYFARRWARKNNIHFSTAVHTLFPEFIAERAPKFLKKITTKIGYIFLRDFHNAAKSVLVTTPSMQEMLIEKGFKNTAIWSRGVDLSIFHPNYDPVPLYEELKAAHPAKNAKIYMYFGRVAPEKSVEDFLKMDLEDGVKVVIGPGPDGSKLFETDTYVNKLKEQHPDAHFIGAKYKEELAQHIAASDVFVFPSKTDTFGRVLIESLACGTPVAAYPVQGPVDIITAEGCGSLNDDLFQAVKAAAADSEKENCLEKCLAHAKNFTPEAATNQFLEHIVHATEK